MISKKDCLLLTITSIVICLYYTIERKICFFPLKMGSFYNWTFSSQL